MEVVIVIIALIYSVWSEIQKKKQEEDANIDFSELTTLDDFFKTPGGGAGQAVDIDNTAKRAREKRAKKKKQPAPAYEQPVAEAGLAAMPARGEVNYDQMPSLETKGYESSFGRVEVNYDELPALTGRNYEAQAGRAEVNYDAMPAVSGRTNYEDEVPEARASTMVRLTSTDDDSEHRHRDSFRLNRQDLLKTFVLSEVLQRYNINRIYERIPGIRSED